MLNLNLILILNKNRPPFEYMLKLVHINFIIGKISKKKHVYKCVIACIIISLLMFLKTPESLVFAIKYLKSRYIIIRHTVQL